MLVAAGWKPDCFWWWPKFEFTYHSHFLGISFVVRTGSQKIPTYPWNIAGTLLHLLKTRSHMFRKVVGISLGWCVFAFSFKNSRPILVFECHRLMLDPLHASHWIEIPSRCQPCGRRICNLSLPNSVVSVKRHQKNTHPLCLNFISSHNYSIIWFHWRGWCNPNLTRPQVSEFCRVYFLDKSIPFREIIFRLESRTFFVRYWYVSALLDRVPKDVRNLWWPKVMCFRLPPQGKPIMLAWMSWSWPPARCGAWLWWMMASSYM